jgi:hypothetical protein
MAKQTYEKEITALHVIDPYNDFISEGGELWDRVKAVAEANNWVPLQKIRTFYKIVENLHNNAHFEPLPIWDNNV